VVATDAHALVVCDGHVEVTLGDDLDTFTTCVVIEGELVVPRHLAFERRARAKATTCLVLRKRERGRMCGVGECADDDRAVRIPAEKGDQDLHPDSRNELGAPASPRPTLGYSNPARGLSIDARIQIPVESNLHSAERIGVDLLAGWARHDGCLKRLPNAAARSGRAPHERRRDGHEVVLVGRVGRESVPSMLYRDHRELPGARGVWVVVQLDA
jgi:hypothetical protein